MVSYSLSQDWCVNESELAKLTRTIMEVLRYENYYV